MYCCEGFISFNVAYGVVNKGKLFVEKCFIFVEDVLMVDFDFFLGNFGKYLGINYILERIPEILWIGDGVWDG